jgi:uncharacterized protein YdhG (YjbR/CyaY superfamily)
MDGKKLVEDYIKRHSPEVQKIFQKIRSEIKKSAPDAEEVMSYGVPAFKKNENTVLYSVFKNHIGLYPTPLAINHFKKELSEYETSKGTIKFPLNKSIPYDLIRKIVKFKFKN